MKQPLSLTADGTAAMTYRPGRFRIRAGLPGYFDPAWYLEAYPDVAAAGRDPRWHYLRHGRNEGRLPCFLTAPLWERDLRMGLSEDSAASLGRVALGHEAGPDRTWAILACARLAGRQGDWLRADGWLRSLETETDLLRGFCLTDTALLAAEAAVMAGDTARAAAIQTRARALFGPLPDLALCAANIAAARSGFGRDWHRGLTLMYARAGLGGIAVAPEAGPAGTPAFDRLSPAEPDGLQRLSRFLQRVQKGPLVSVIMPARNAGATIVTALRSLHDQSWQALEILVVDNGSGDDTAAIVRQAAIKDPRIRLIDGHSEPGAYAARNLGVAAASGAFITVLDADDWAHPARIARQVRALNRHPRCAASVAHWVRTTPDLRFTRWWREEGLVHRDVSSLMIRSETRATLGFWDRARAGADTEYYHRIQAVFGETAIREVNPGLPLSFGRVLPRSLTQQAETEIGSHLFGTRRDYRLAGQRWHLRMKEAGDLPLPQYPSRRPYPVPAALALSPPDPAPAPCEVESLAGGGFYDDTWYMQTYPDLRARDADGMLHYPTEGAAEGRDPGPGFSTSGYRMAYGPFEGASLPHYLTQGRPRGHSPLPVFGGALPPPLSGRHLLFFGHQAKEQIFGAERCLLTLLDHAVVAGFTPSVVLPQCLNPDYLAELRARAFEVHIIPYGWLYGGMRPHPATVARLTQLVRDSGAVEIHQNTAVMDAPLYAARAAGVPSVVHVHELPAQDPNLCLDLGASAVEIRRLMTGHATRFVANSPAVSSWLDLPAERLLLLPNQVDSALESLAFAPGSPPRVALIGSLINKKGVADFVAVARDCARNGTSAQFLLIGPETPDIARLRPFPPNLTHTGYAAGPVAAIAQADIVMSLSHFAESFGMTVLEAMTAGRPVICYDRGTPPALLGNSGAGTVVPADDLKAAARALRGLLATPSGLKIASRAARTRAEALRKQGQAFPENGLFLRKSA
tara:strand:+ start:2093 stop:5008 length:2916 start_codon:yes stop_codon:yes gene_type:complete